MMGDRAPLFVEGMLLMSSPVSRFTVHFDPIRAHRSFGVPDRYEFVPNRTAEYLNVFDLATRRCVKRIKVGGRPDVTATTADARYLYVAGEVLAIVDLETLAVIRTLSGGGIHAHYAANLFPDGRRYINANWHTNSVFALDLTPDYSVTTLVPSGFDKPDDLVMSIDERKGYTASHGSGEQPQGAVHVFDPVAGPPCVIKAIHTGRRPAGLTMSPDGRIVYATNVPDGSITAIDVEADRVLYTASAAPLYRAAGITGDHLDIEGVTVSADGKTLYAYSVNYGALVIFDDLGGLNRPQFIAGEVT